MAAVERQWRRTFGEQAKAGSPGCRTATAGWRPLRLWLLAWGDQEASFGAKGLTRTLPARLRDADQPTQSRPRPRCTPTDFELPPCRSAGVISIRAHVSGRVFLLVRRRPGGHAPVGIRHGAAQRRALQLHPKRPRPTRGR